MDSIILSFICTVVEKVCEHWLDFVFILINIYNRVIYFQIDLNCCQIQINEIINISFVNHNIVNPVGSLNDKPRSGRPGAPQRETTACVLYRLSTANRKKTAPELKRQCTQQSGIQRTTITVRWEASETWFQIVLG